MLFYSGSDSGDGGLSRLVLWSDDVDGFAEVSSIALQSPSWVVPHPVLPILYATQESEPGAVVAVAVAPDGSMQVHQRTDSQGGLPCHLAVDVAGTKLVVSNYQDGVVTAWRLATDGTLELPGRVWQLAAAGPAIEGQEQSHAHMAQLRGDRIVVADLGADALHELMPAGGSRALLSLPRGFGPRHFVMVGDDRAVLVGERSAELALIDLGSRPRVLDLVPVTPRGFSEPSGITAHGREVIVANRVVGTIASFTVEGDRLLPGEEIRLPGDNPRAISSDTLRTFVCLADVGLIATYTHGDSDGPRLARAANVSDFGAIPWSR